MRKVRFSLSCGALLAGALLCPLLVSCARAAPVAVTRLDAPFLFAYGTWDKKVSIAGGVVALRGEAVNGQGGAGVNANLDLSEHETEPLSLRVRVGANNTLRTLKLLLVDTSGKSAIWEFPLPAPSNAFVTIMARDDATLGKPHTAEKGAPDLSKIMQWQLQGDWSQSVVDLDVNAISIGATTPATTLATPPVANAANTIISDLDAPFLFAYGTWDKKVSVQGGVAALRGEGVNGQGGAGFNANLNLAAMGQLVPQLRVKVGAGNTVKILKLMLRDAQEHAATYEFAVPDARDEFVVLTPREGADLKSPTTIDKGLPDFANITQCQVIGDWSGGALNLELDRIALEAATPAALAERQARDTRLAQEAEALKQERAALRQKYTRGASSPRLAHLAPVAPNVLQLTITSGRVIPALLTKYVAQANDEKREKKDDKGEVYEVVLVRNGGEIGYLVGPKREWLNTMEGFEGDPLLEFVADDAASYTLSSNDDASFKVKPQVIGRKSKPTNWSLGSSNFEMRHDIFLRLPRALSPGKSYSLNVGELNTREASISLKANAPVRSDAVHVNQIGYRPDDPAKRAFVSCWLGTGGALKLPPTLRFSLLEEKTGKVAYSGQSNAYWPADKIELMQSERNFNGTDVVRLDFSSFKTPGRYRVAVDGIGTSYPFEIGANVWRRAFLTQMKGLYNQRSGMELGPPYTTYQKPRDMNPQDGYRVTQTRYRAVESGGEAWAAIPAGDTGAPANGWGGYHDAGDWNPRRVSHMRVTMAQLEVFELFPQFYAPMKLNIPATPGVPDVLTEAVWEFETFHRLQHANGGVGYGLESKADPAQGETSWLNSFSSYALAPDYSASWYYAAVGARLGRLLQPYNAKLAKTYLASATRAFAFAETDFARDKAAGLTEKRGNTWENVDNRNLAALELYISTRDQKYHDVFLQDTVLKDAKPNLFVWTRAAQREHAFIYARLPQGLGDAAMKAKAVAGVREMAERALNYASNNAFNLTTSDKGKPQFLGFYSTPDATDLVHAHFLTRDPKYLEGAVQATQFQSGANPLNAVYMTGLGANPLKHVFKLDSRRTGQATPSGLVPYGNIDFAKWNGTHITWPITWFLSKNTTPNPYEWPTHEAYWDLGGWPMLEEFTVDRWDSNVSVWGYLAARK